MRQIPTKIDGQSVLPAAEVNSLTNEVMNAVTGSGQTLSTTDNTQLGKALTWGAQLGNFYTDSGTANTCTLANTQYAPTAYVEGMFVRFIKSATNSGAVTINVSAIGAVNLLSSSGSTLLSNHLPLGAVVEARYSQALGAFVLNSPTSLGGTTVATIGAASAGGNLTLAQMNTIINVTVSASTTLVLPALATVPEGGRFTVVRNSAAAFPLILDGNGAELVGSLADQRLWGTSALMEVTKINNLWVVTRSIDPTISVYMFSTGFLSMSSSTYTATNITGVGALEGGVSSAWYDASSKIIPQIPGVYSLEGQTLFLANATGLRLCFLAVNGTNLPCYPNNQDILQSAISGVNMIQTTSAPAVTINGSTDYIQLIGYQTSGTGINTAGYLKATLVKRTI